MENHIRPRRKGDCVSKNNLCRVICFQKVFACFIHPLVFLTIAKFTSYLISFVDHYGRRPNIILHSMRIILTCSFFFSYIERMNMEDVNLTEEMKRNFIIVTLAANRLTMLNRNVKFLFLFHAHREY